MIPANARKASFASPELGMAAATSGSRTTTALAAAYRDANLLGSPRLKSYSGRISSASTRSAVVPLLRDFFIISSLWTCSLSSTDDANRLGALKVHNREQTTLFRNATKRSSTTECLGSARILPSGSPKTVAASSNGTLCLARFPAAFRGSHSNSSANLHYTCGCKDGAPAEFSRVFGRPGLRTFKILYVTPRGSDAPH
jgi:hypothetical protein